jgi:hypothetical protein
MDAYRNLCKVAAGNCCIMIRLNTDDIIKCHRRKILLQLLTLCSTQLIRIRPHCFQLNRKCLETLLSGEVGIVESMGPISRRVPFSRVRHLRSLFSYNCGAPRDIFPIFTN